MSSFTIIIKVEKEGSRGELVTKESQFKFTSSKGPGVPALLVTKPWEGLMPALSAQVPAVSYLSHCPPFSRPPLLGAGGDAEKRPCSPESPGEALFP